MEKLDSSKINSRCAGVYLSNNGFSYDLKCGISIHIETFEEQVEYVAVKKAAFGVLLHNVNVKLLKQIMLDKQHQNKINYLGYSGCNGYGLLGFENGVIYNVVIKNESVKILFDVNEEDIYIEELDKK